jgi:hypothetical protein
MALRLRGTMTLEWPGPEPSWLSVFVGHTLAENPFEHAPIAGWKIFWADSTRTAELLQPVDCQRGQGPDRTNGAHSSGTSCPEPQ